MTSLTLNDCHLTNQSIISLESLFKSSCPMKHMILANNSLEDNKLGSSVWGLSWRLQSLDLSNTSIGPHVAASLAEALSNELCSLHLLILNNVIVIVVVFIFYFPRNMILSYFGCYHRQDCSLLKTITLIEPDRRWRNVACCQGLVI